MTARLKASVEANRTLLEYYWSLGRDIADRQYANTYGSAFYATLSHDLKAEMLAEKGFSETNIRYMYRFYNLYSQLFINLPHSAEDLERKNFPQSVENLSDKNHQRNVDELSLQNRQQLADDLTDTNSPQRVDESANKNIPHSAEDLIKEICSIPWFHQQRIIDKCKGNPQKHYSMCGKPLKIIGDGTCC